MTLTGSSEVDDVISVCKWAFQKYSRRFILVGSSAGTFGLSDDGKKTSISLVESLFWCMLVSDFQGNTKLFSHFLTFTSCVCFSLTLLSEVTEKQVPFPVSKVCCLEWALNMVVWSLTSLSTLQCGYLVTGWLYLAEQHPVFAGARTAWNQCSFLVHSVPAGAPIAGSALDAVDAVEGYVAIGYVFGFWASVLFGGHFQKVLDSKKPKLFIMGTSDGFTTVAQLKGKLKRAQGTAEMHLVDGVGHFELESPQYDASLAQLIAQFASKVEDF